MNIKQLLCKYLWKKLPETKELSQTEKTTVLYQNRIYDAINSYYAIKNICLKCDKTEYFEEETLIYMEIVNENNVFKHKEKRRFKCISIEHIK